MAKIHQYDANVAKRRELVAQMKLRFGWSARKICETMHQQAVTLNRQTGEPTEGTVNPDTNKPWSKATVIRDLDYLLQEWKAEAAKSMDEIQSNHLRSIRMAREQAWRNNEMGNVLRALKQESELYGLDAPKKVANTDPEGKALPQGRPMLVLGVTSEQDDEVMRLISEDLERLNHAASNGTAQ